DDRSAQHGCRADHEHHDDDHDDHHSDDDWRRDAVSVLAGPFAIAAVILAAGGAAKAVRPRDTARALAAVGIRFPRALPARVVVRVGGALEAAVGLAALLVGGPVLCTLVALSYLMFAVFVGVALRMGAPISSCGCFGKVDTPPSGVHVVLDVAF